VLLTVGGVAVTAIVLGVVVFSVFLLKLTFRGLPLKNDAAAGKPVPAASTPADMK